MTKFTCSTFSFSPENEGPQEGDYLELVVTVAMSSHLSNSAGQDHTFGVHLLNTERHTETDEGAAKTHTKLQLQTHADTHAASWHANNVIALLLTPIICICKSHNYGFSSALFAPINV